MNMEWQQTHAASSLSCGVGSIPPLFVAKRSRDALWEFAGFPWQPHSVVQAHQFRWWAFETVHGGLVLGFWKTIWALVSKGPVLVGVEGRLNRSSPSYYVCDAGWSGGDRLDDRLAVVPRLLACAVQFVGEEGADSHAHLLGLHFRQLRSSRPLRLHPRGHWPWHAGSAQFSDPIVSGEWPLGGVRFSWRVGFVFRQHFLAVFASFRWNFFDGGCFCKCRRGSRCSASFLHLILSWTMDNCEVCSFLSKAEAADNFYTE